MLLPSTATPRAARLILARALRGFADGFVSVYLASYLQLLGLTSFQIGAVITSTLLGSAALTLWSGLSAHRLQARHILFGATALMAATGLGFAAFTNFWPLLLIAFAGTLNPSAGDVSVFLPIEQGLLAGASAAKDRTTLFGWYSMSGTLLGAFGALASGLPERAAVAWGWERLNAFRAGFLVYAVVAVGIALLYKGMPHLSSGPKPDVRAPLRQSRAIVLRLTALFSLDSFGSGLAVESLVAFWFYIRFALPIETVGTIFFAARTLAAFSHLVSPRLAARFGLIETMVFTHIPANLFLILSALMPSAQLAVLFMLLRMALSSMDVAARQSFVMSVVPPEERAAAASITNVPRSLASAISPLIAGALLQLSTFGWPLIAAGAIKIVYDILLLVQFRRVRTVA
jgi:MFS family permease